MAKAQAFEEPAEAPCARCRRVTPADDLALWTTRERLRSLSRQSGLAAPAVANERRDLAVLEAPPRPAFRHETRTRVDAVCPQCWGRLSKGAPLDGPERGRIAVTLVVFLVLAVLIAWGVATHPANLVAAFWRNGAGGR